MQFGVRLKELREEKGITQRELGNIVNVSDRVIGYYESNDRFPKDENVLRKIADYFNVTVDYLLGRTGIKTAYSERINESGSNIYRIDTTDLTDEDITYIDTIISAIKAKRKTSKNKPGQGLF